MPTPPKNNAFKTHFAKHFKISRGFQRRVCSSSSSSTDAQTKTLREQESVSETIVDAYRTGDMVGSDGSTQNQRNNQGLAAGQ